MEATMPPINARMAMCPKAFELRLFSSGSSTIRSVAAIVRMISGRKRSVSTRLKAALAGMRHLRVLIGLRPCQLNPDRHIHLGLFEHARGRFADRGQERLRVNAHPNHHRDQGNYGGPLAGFKIEHVMAN